MARGFSAFAKGEWAVAAEAIGTLLAATIGPLATSMVLIHPLLRANAHRPDKLHMVVLFIILNVMLSMLIVKPITRLSEAADKISTGDMDIPEFGEKGRDEVALLGRAFNRMRRSLEKAISLIDEK